MAAATGEEEEGVGRGGGGAIAGGGGIEQAAAAVQQPQQEHTRTRPRPPPQILQLSSTPSDSVYISCGTGGRTVIVLKERPVDAPPRAWHALRRSGGAGVVIMERTQLPSLGCLVPGDFGLTSAVLVDDATGVKHFFGMNDGLDDWLRR